jgi:outer membrane protein OmpA-like peptidoglycan-associated protein
MAVLENGGQPRVARAWVQAWLAKAWFGPIAFGGLACLCGCSNIHQKGPEAWWHDSIGGKVAKERPPPPGDKDPFPNLATVPPAPAKPDAAAWNRVTAGLITDRINAREAAALAPIPAAAPGRPASPPFDPGQHPQAGASAALTAASPPPAAPPGTSPAPAHATAAPPSSNADVPAPGSPTVATEAALVAGGHLPPLPTQEPPRPNIAPGPPPPLLPITAAPPSAPRPPPDGDEIDFAQGSAALNDPALAEVKALAATRGDRGIAVTGYGDATSSDAVGQSAALGLGFSRAQAVATALVAQGVPYDRLRLNAEAAGRGASLRLLQ